MPGYRSGAGAVAVGVFMAVPAASLRTETMESRWLTWSRRQRLSRRPASRRPGETQGRHLAVPHKRHFDKRPPQQSRKGWHRQMSYIGFELFVAQGPDSGHLFHLIGVEASSEKTSMPNEQTTPSDTVSAYSDPSHSDFFPLPRPQSQKFVLQEPNPRVRRIRAVSRLLFLPQRTQSRGDKQHE
jgi:hypothetical protein